MGDMASAVLGVGPAGLAVAARLLDINHKVVLLDPNSGRLARFPSVPSNTKVKLFLKFCELSPSLMRAAKLHKPAAKALANLRACDPEHGCRLALASDLVETLADGLVVAFPTSVERLRERCDRIEVGRDIKLCLLRSKTVESVYLCTGSVPKTLSAPNILDLEECFTEKIDGVDGLRVVIVGLSHSGVLAARNLCLSGAKSVVLIGKPGQPRFAEEMNGWILNDNTGLKGEVAKWLETLIRFQKPQNASISYDEKPHLASADRVVYAVGYERAKLPEIVTQTGIVRSVTYDPVNGTLILDGKRESRMRGFGIAFPETVTDPLGNVESSVGMYKFQCYVQRVIQ